MMNDETTREQLAEYAHDAWSSWMKYLFQQGQFKGKIVEGKHVMEWIMPAWFVERWQRQMNTPYADLPESEKESDREEADRMLAIVRGKCYCGCDACKYCERLLEAQP